MTNSNSEELAAINLEATSQLKDLCDTYIDGVVEAPQETTELNKSSESSDEFASRVITSLKKSKTTWRSTCALAHELGVNPKSLDELLKTIPGLVYRESNKNKETYFWAIQSRVKLEESDKTKLKKAKPPVSEKERYALSAIACSYHLFHDALDKYALTISEKDQHALSLLTKALKKMQVGLASYGATIQADMSKLPRFND